MSNLNSSSPATIAAEQSARQRRIDRDRIIRAALDVTETVAIDTVHAGDTHHCIPAFDASALDYIAGISDIPLDRFAGPRERAAYVRALLLSIRGELSPRSR